jgi:hypothetical protein
MQDYSEFIYSCSYLKKNHSIDLFDFEEFLIQKKNSIGGCILLKNASVGGHQNQ